MTVLAQRARLPHLPRTRSWQRRATRAARSMTRSGVAGLHRMPAPASLRRALGSLTLWRRNAVIVPVGRVLLGGQDQLSGSEFALRIDDLQWPSRRVVDGPHADLLRRAATGPLTDDEILASPYAEMAEHIIAVTGQYFAATDRAGIVVVARRFIDHAAGQDTGGPLPNQSPPGEPVRLAPIRHSDCYQVVDGHHRIALLAHQGVPTVIARVKRLSVSTPLQDLLEQMSWTGGTRELYQPVDSPEIERGWIRVRRCTDRLTVMRSVLEHLGIPGEGSSYLDVASCYGWFVARFADLGFDAHGVERDPAGPQIGALAYGLDPSRVRVDDAEEFLAAVDVTWDVVSCFSLLHHFVLGRSTIDAAELVRRLDRITGRVLFLDTGQSHEAWFRESLPEWDSTHVADFITEHSTFSRVVDLGPDADAVPPYEQNYGRHLFAAIRD